MDAYSYKFNTKFGEMKIYFTCDALVALSLPQEIEEESSYIKKNFDNVTRVDMDKYGYSNEILDYLDGKLKKFSIPIYFKGTEFQEKVWKELLNIPYGETKTYKEIGQIIGCEKGPRAVGGALNKNPIAIIVPCHRVIGSNGKLVGFAGGLDLKEKLILLEKEYS